MNALHLDAEGWVEEARRIPSPNCDARPPGMPVELLVVHNISLPPGKFGGNGVAALFTNTLDPEAHPYYREIHQLRVSAHFLIRRDGELVQFVACNQRAWHAGVSEWRGRTRCNDFSIGIELEGDDATPFEPAQYGMLNALIACLGDRYPLAGVAGHSDIAPGRKTDPGPCFDWARVAFKPSAVRSTT
jgi:AmpD protein